MQVSGLGKINVPTAGTPVAFSATSLKVARVTVSFDPADTTSTVYVKDSAGNTVAALTSSSKSPLLLGSGESNLLDISKLYADSSANNKGPFVGYVIL